MKRTRDRGNSGGFALPTVMIASVVMLIVLLSGLVSASSVNTAIKQQYQQKVLQLAVESGVAKTNACLAKSNQIVTWSDANPLRPNTDCNGTVIVAAPVPSAYIVDTTTLKSTFEVPLPVDNNGTQRVNVIGKILKYRVSGGGAPLEETETRSALVGGQNSFSNVAFGYYSGDGAQFAVVLPTGEVKGIGTNGNGRLGNGTLSNTLVPTNFILPNNEKGVSAYTNFLSLGLNLYVITQTGKVYGAGGNTNGQLGNGSVATNVSTPVQFGTLGNTSQPKARFVAPLQNSAFVIADDNNIYSVGECNYGLLGRTNCTVGSYSATPSRVALPTVNSGDLNTLPVADPGWVQPTNLVADRITMYARMQGGAVYAWGYNDYGQLGTGNTTQANTPIRLQALSSTGAPYLNTGTNSGQIAFNGTAVYVLDSTGQVWAAGTNGTGEQLGAGVTVRNDFSTNCLRKDPGSSNLLEAACNKADGWQFMEFWPDASSTTGTIRFRTNSGTYGPTDSMLCAHVASQYSTVTMQTCNGSANQTFQFESDGKLYNPTFFTCARSTGGVVTMATCAQGADFFWRTQDNWYLRPVPRPPFDAALGRHPMYTRITTDNRATMLMDENGDVWAAGGNNRYQLGVGNLGTYNPVLRRVNLPGGIKAADIYVTETNPYSPSTGVNAGSYSNGYIIGRDGNVYGSGGNNYGQLGYGTSCNGSTTDYGILMKMNLPAGVIAKSVQSGFGTTVVLSTTGKVYTVGNNSNGQLGNGTVVSCSQPQANEYTNQRSTIIY